MPRAVKHAFGRVFGAIVLTSLTACSGPGSGVLRQDHSWHTERQVSNTNKTAACTLFSSPRPFASGAGLDQVRIIIRREGIVTLQSTQDPFDTAVRAQIGVRVDNNDAVMSPKVGPSARELVFSPTDSAKLIDQFRTGKVARIQLALAPRRELLATSFALDEFPEALQEYRLCEVVRADQSASDSRPWRRQAVN